VDKVARKYFSFALRIAVQDCGCSFEVLRLVAEALGVPLRARARWDEQRIARALGDDTTRLTDLMLDISELLRSRWFGAPRLNLRKY